MVRWIVGIACAVVALAVLGLVFFFGKTQTDEKKYTVQRRELGRSAYGLGKVESRIPEQPLGFVIGGRLKSVLVVEGQSVKAKEQLALLDTPDFEARIAAAQAVLDEAKAREKLVKLGPRPEEYKPLEERLAQAAKDVEVAQVRLKQMENPVARPVPESEIELARLDEKRLLHLSNEAVFSQNKIVAGPSADEKAISEGKWSIAELDHRDIKEQYETQEKDNWPVSNAYAKTREMDKIAFRNQVERAKLRKQLAQAENDLLKKGAGEEEKHAATERAEAAKLAYDMAVKKLSYLENPPPPPQNNKYDIQLAKLAVEQAQAAQREAEAALQRAKLGPRPEDLEVAQAAVVRAQRALEEINALGDQGKLLAPTDGIVLARYREPGSALLPGEPVVRIGDTKDLRLRGEVSADWSAQLRPGQVVMLMGNLLSGGPLPAKIERVLPAVGPKKLFSDDPREIKGGQVLELLIEIDPVQSEAAHASYSALRPGVRLDIKIDFDARGNVLVVPRGFVRFENNKYLVQRAVTGSDGKVGRTEEVEIGIGWRNEMDYEVISGLREGDILVRPMASAPMAPASH